MKPDLFRSAPMVIALALSSSVIAGEFGFANKPGGGFDDPIIEVGVQTSTFLGAPISLSEGDANDLFQFQLTSGRYGVSSPAPTLPGNSNGGNAFFRLKFPMPLRASLAQSLAAPSPALAATSFLTSNLTITDENGVHVPGIVLINGRDVFGVDQSSHPLFPDWLDLLGFNKLLGKDVLTYVADDGDQSLATPAAFGATPANPTVSSIKEIHIRLNSVGPVIVNGHWVVKIGDASGNPVPGQPPLTVSSIEANSPVIPPLVDNGHEVVEAFSKYVLRFSEPVVPISVGLSAAYVAEFNAANPSIPLLFNGNIGAVPNPSDLSHPYIPTSGLVVAANSSVSFPAPVSIRPINPNNFSEYVVTSILDLPADADAILLSLAGGGLQYSSATSLFDLPLDAASAATSATTFHVDDASRGLVNAPVAPQAIYYTTLDGGLGTLNLDGNGFETNDPAVNRLHILTSTELLCSCPANPPLLAGSYLLGCNGNGFGDYTGTNPVGIAGNPSGSQVGPSTPVPGVNEGSTGSTANLGLTTPIFPVGFETIVRDSKGISRLADDDVGAALDVQVGDFLDKIYFDSNNPGAASALHASFVAQVLLDQNSISDPPVPNPPPLRVPVGLPPLVTQLTPTSSSLASVIEGSEVFTANISCGLASPPQASVLLLPNTLNPFAGDLFPSFAQNGPDPKDSSVPLAPYAARQQIGNYLYVTDGDRGVLRVLNSNTFRLLDTIELPDPTGLGLTPDLSLLFVSNFRDGSVSVIDTNPLSATFHQEVNRINVGEGPRAISVQPDGEDVFVCNFLGNSVSVIDLASQVVRKTLTRKIHRPTEVIATPRHNVTGFQSQTYFAFIANQGSDEIAIYESGPTTVGFDEVKWTAITNGAIADISGMVYDPGTFTGSTTSLPGGVFVAHSDPITGQPMVSRIAWTTQLPLAGPLTPSPTVDRRFEIVAQWGGAITPLLPGAMTTSPTDLALSDFNTREFYQPTGTDTQTNWGALAPPTGATIANHKHPVRMILGNAVPTVASDRLYISLSQDGAIVVVDPNSPGSSVNVISGIPLVSRLSSYFDS